MKWQRAYEDGAGKCGGGAEKWFRVKFSTATSRI